MRAPAGWQTEHPAHPPPPSQGQRPTRCRATPRHRHAAQGACGRPKACARDGGTAPPTTPPPQVRGHNPGPGFGYEPPDRPDPCTTGSPTPAATQPNRQGTEGASQQREHDASDPGADAEVTETSGPQESDDPLPAATTCLVPRQQEPSTEYVPGGHPGTTSRQPSPTRATLDQDRVTMPPPPPGHRSRGARAPLTTRN